MEIYSESSGFLRILKQADGKRIKSLEGVSFKKSKKERTLIWSHERQTWARPAH